MASFVSASNSNEEDGYSCISGETLKKAMAELNEDPTTRSSMVREFRERILKMEKQIGDGDSIIYERKDRNFLLRFLRARKFNIERSVQLYVNYYKYRHKFRHLLTNCHPQYVSNVLNAGIFGVLEESLKNKSRVLCVIPSRWNYVAVPPIDPYKTFVMILEKLVEDEEVQVHGLSIFDNMEGVSWHLTYAFLRSEPLQRGALVELQDSFPLRFKGLYMLNQPWYLSMIMTVVKPFLSQKHRDRIQAHGSNYRALYEYIDASKLPANFGGSADSLEADNLKKFFESDEFIY